MNTNFSANKTPVEIVKEGASGGTYFRDICSGINVNGIESRRKNIDQKYYS